MVAFRMVGRREIEVETQACKARIDYAYEPGFVFVNLFDKLLSELFTIMMDDDEQSRRKLEKLINEGVSEEEAEFLRIIQSFSTPKAQAKYFERFSKGELTLEGALKGVRSRKECYMNYMVAKYLKEVEKRSRPVCALGDWAHPMKVLHLEAGGNRILLFVERGRKIHLSYLMVINSEVNLYKVTSSHPTQATFSTFRYIVVRYMGNRDFCKNSDEVKVLCGGLSEACFVDFKVLSDFLKHHEEQGSIVVYDRELYDYIKSLIAMNVIVGH